MRKRQSARLLVIDRENRVLLFRFVHTRGPLAGLDCWATPGGGLEEGETFEQAGIRELFEETGMVVDAIGPQIEAREFTMKLPDGEMVLADERFFVVPASEQVLSSERWTDLEIEVMIEHRWWSATDLRATKETVFPRDLADILDSVRNHAI